MGGAKATPSSSQDTRKGSSGAVLMSEFIPNL